jgi:hypothetical protein
VDNRNDVRELLISRHAKVTPEQAGIPAGTSRRVPGLRRSEVAMLADVSIEYYSRVERGHLSGVSDSVLDALARALQLDDAERQHLFGLARTANASPAVARRRRPSERAVGPGVQVMLDAITAVPAVVRTGRMDIVAANRLGHALYCEMFASPERPANLARFTFLDRDRAERFHPDWEQAADICVAILRTEAGRDPYDKHLQDLIGELSTRSEDFRTRWGAHNVRRHSTGLKHFHHPAVGDLDLTYREMALVGEPACPSWCTPPIPAPAPGTPRVYSPDGRPPRTRPNRPRHRRRPRARA